MPPVVTSVPVGALPFDRFEGVLEPQVWRALSEAVDRGREELAGRAVWNVNSTAKGGGVAEMLVSLLAYARGAGIDARWEVIEGNEPFFAVTKRIHNHLHGAPGDGGELGAAEREVYETTTRENAEVLAEAIGPDDLVLLHDPQTAGMIPLLKGLGVPVVWRCHVGLDVGNDVARGAWAFLRPWVEQADAYVFSRRAFVWDGLEDDKLVLIAPSIDAFSPKNQDLSAAQVAAILGQAGLETDGAGDGAAEATFTREDGSPGRVLRRAVADEARPLRPEDRVVLQVSRWDRLKDPLGVIRGFAEHVAPATDAHLVYAGPACEEVADDPEGVEVLAEARAFYAELPGDVREQIHLVTLPMDDAGENAAIVNALQRRADVVVQKSLAEGFGLTVAEGMWKARPVVASRIGGIQDQIEDGRSGVLVADPANLGEYGRAVRAMLDSPERAHSIGDRARERVRDGFLGTRSLFQYLELSRRLLA